MDEKLVSFRVVFRSTLVTTSSDDAPVFYGRATPEIVAEITRDFKANVHAGVYAVRESEGASFRPGTLAVRFEDVLYIS